MARFIFYMPTYKPKDRPEGQPSEPPPLTSQHLLETKWVGQNSRNPNRRVTLHVLSKGQKPDTVLCLPVLSVTASEPKGMGHHMALFDLLKAGVPSLLRVP